MVIPLDIYNVYTLKSTVYYFSETQNFLKTIGAIIVVAKLIKISAENISREINLWLKARLAITSSISPFGLKKLNIQF